jgi:hypothetical protein
VSREWQAGEEHPNHRQIAGNMGRRLETLRVFTQPRGYPDLGCLVVSTGGRSPQLPAAVAMQALARAFDWSGVSHDMLTQMQACQDALSSEPSRTVSDAKGYKPSERSARIARIFRLPRSWR